MARRRKKLTDEDKVLWKRVTSTVDPTQEPVGLVAASKKPEELYTRFVKLMSASKPIQAPKVKSPPPVPPRAQVVPKYNQTLDHKTRKKIVKGRIPIEAKIDLHGMTQNIAIAVMGDFLHRAQSNDCRLVLVITGKGDKGNGILRRQVPNWLSNTDLKGVVSSFQEAHISHGGAGALYVRIKRN